jgi:hypothetical protein
VDPTTVEVAPPLPPPVDTSSVAEVPPPTGNLRGSNVPKTDAVGQASQAAAATAAGAGECISSVGEELSFCEEAWSVLRLEARRTHTPPAPV